MKKKVLVTGASRGIGRAIALELADAGFEVLLNFKSNQAKAAEVLDKIQTKGGSGSLLPFDISAREATRKCLEENIQQSGCFYGAVCNAGIAADAAFPALSGEDWDTVMKTNLDGFYNVLHPLVMPMIWNSTTLPVDYCLAAAGQVRRHVTSSANRDNFVKKRRTYRHAFINQCLGR